MSKRIYRLFKFISAVNTPMTLLPAMQNGYITFGYSGRNMRLSCGVFDAWAQLLDGIPDARPVIYYMWFSNASTREYYETLMSGFGIDMSRVTLRFSSDVFTALGEVDILLDSFPHSGGTMLFDALWVGVPAITLAG